MATTRGPDTVAVTDNLAEHRYEVRVAGELAGFSEYALQPSSITFLHTEIDPRFEGRGIGSKLATAVLDDARAKKLRVVPLCPFIAAYIRRHPEYDDIVTPAHRHRLAAEREREKAARG